MEKLSSTMEKSTDVVVLTDRRYVIPEGKDTYTRNVLLEDRLVHTALERQGLRVQRKSWDDDDFDWSCSKILLFRTTWDYFDRYAEFEPWLKRVAQKCVLMNAAEVLYWNLDKHYLSDLKSKGINIPPTLFFDRGSTANLSRVLKENNWEKAVIKPCISGAGRHTYKVSDSNAESMQKVLNELLQNESMMIQEFQQEIVNKGELSLMIINGEYTHAVLKQARKGEFRVQDDFGGSVTPYNASTEEIRFAEKCAAVSGFDLTYARVDIFRDNHGALCLAELELIEPEMWFRLNPEAADSLAQAIVKKLF